MNTERQTQRQPERLVKCDECPQFIQHERACALGYFECGATTTAPRGAGILSPAVIDGLPAEPRPPLSPEMEAEISAALGAWMEAQTGGSR